MSQNPGIRRKSGAPRGPRQHGDRRAAILDVAEGLALQDGPDSLNVDHVAELAGFAKGTFYHYFSSRGALLDAVVDRHFSRLAMAATGRAAGCATPEFEGRLHGWINEVALDIRAYPHMHQFAARKSQADAESNWQPLVHSLKNLIVWGVAAGEWDAEDPLAMAIFLFNGMLGLTAALHIEKPIESNLTPTLVCWFRRMLARR